MADLHELLAEQGFAQNVASNVLTIAEGLLDRNQMAALACVAKHFSVAYELKYANGMATPTVE